ncbi:MAG: hypothetical protein JWN27_421 [Candidatus Eremiobacteraeota bacterium]|nr:hypothetical protein [Candidatus Eremiobacteraeota bacterium]
MTHAVERAEMSDAMRLTGVMPYAIDQTAAECLWSLGNDLVGF